MASVKGITRITVAAGTAKPSPAIGQALGPLGVNMMEFCKDFNAKTGTFRPTALMRVHLTAFEDRTFVYKILAPSGSWYLKRCSGVVKGASNPGKEVVGSISIKAIYEIALSKQKFDPEQKFHPIQGICKCLIGQARSIGLRVTK